MRITLRPARAEDVAQLADEPLPHRIQAITAELDGKPIGIGGLGFRPDGTVIAFARLSDEFRRYPAAVHRAGRAGMALIRRSGVPVVIAQAQPENPAAERWLQHFGFKPLETARGLVFVWRKEVARDAD